jgi:hypothetical protein
MNEMMLNFIRHCEGEGWSPDYILSQLKLYLSGVRDSRLHDNVCAFLPCDREVVDLVRSGHWRPERLI